MLRTLTFVAVWQQTNQPGHAQPFALAGRDELIEQNLGAVGEIAELRFPQRQRIRLGQRIAVLEAEHGFFRQHRIDDFETRLAVTEIVKRRVAFLVFLIDQHRVALREGAAFGILTRKPDPMRLAQQRTECERFGGRPIDPGAGLDRFAPIVEKAVQSAVQMEIGRQRGDLAADIL